MQYQKIVVPLHRILSVVVLMAPENSETFAAVKQLCEQYKAAMAENERLRTELSETRRALVSAQNQIDTLNAKYDRLKLARAYGWNEAQKRNATDRITKLVREIDNCLSLLRKMN